MGQRLLRFGNQYQKPEQILLLHNQLPLVNHILQKQIEEILDSQPW
ncbi:3193_t:CDS:2 [Dentiscutata heterogama]|uniref:3193_t:CDS:1 n=1 Tax=Dentiscutata heterogama TaxID=1316150 RepID=A0ACA9M340_9GLOM|nr:3193_t:CDS:2 [Dentiscutata heterogama]